MRHSLIAPVLAVLTATPALAGTISVQVPRIDVTEYHKPYVAIWLEPADGSPRRTLAVWYDAHHRGEPGTKWLSELRGWWRVAGRTMTALPEGISGPTRAPGQYTIPLPGDLRPGAYTLKIEAARETGGREEVSLPVNVPHTGGHGAGHAELGTIGVALP